MLAREAAACSLYSDMGLLDQRIATRQFWRWRAGPPGERIDDRVCRFGLVLRVMPAVANRNKFGEPRGFGCDGACDGTIPFKNGSQHTAPGPLLFAWAVGGRSSGCFPYRGHDDRRFLLRVRGVFDFEHCNDNVTVPIAYQNVLGELRTLVSDDDCFDLLRDWYVDGWPPRNDGSVQQRAEATLSADDCLFVINAHLARAADDPNAALGGACRPP
ncbi:MAG TPA: hypothetical protein VF292_05130 [Rhodanobacteraceae bacterium]